jgi:hypothetical protein
VCQDDEKKAAEARAAGVPVKAAEPPKEKPKEVKVGVTGSIRERGGKGKRRGVCNLAGCGMSLNCMCKCLPRHVCCQTQ